MTVLWFALACLAGCSDDDSHSDVFDGFQVRCSASETELRGSVSDQAQLFGYLLRLRDLGIHLVSVNPVAS